LSKYFITVPASIFLEQLGLNIAIYLENRNISLGILLVTISLRFAYLMLVGSAFALSIPYNFLILKYWFLQLFIQLTQRLFGGRKLEHPLDGIETAISSLLILLSLLFLFFHIQLNL